MAEQPTPSDPSPLSATVSNSALHGPLPTFLSESGSGPHEALAAALPRTAAAYRIEEEIGHGGMGVVLRVRDAGLARDLAAKVLLPEQRGNPAAVSRFLEEARITGQLQHPGVPPVHDLGRLADGRPYFTMKLVRGETLATLLRQRPNPAAERPRFLKVFEQLCQTVAYAHSKGVIHRDLKPANVMVGRFGEVQVMDWGLAKVLAGGERASAAEAEPAAEAASVLDTRADTNELLTQAGSILGTFAYMPPEQARGEIERLDERCDVFGLGAVLCVLLTGLPPYSHADPEVVRARARRGDLAEALARLDGCGAEGELLGLAKRCLASELGDRPRNAGEVTQAMTAYLAAVEERARQAEVERAAAQARAEEAKAKAAAERRARRLTLALAAVVLVVLAVVGVGGWLLQQQAQARAADALRRQAEVDGAVRASIGEGRLLLDQAKSAPLHDAGQLLQAQAAAHKAAELARAREASQAVRDLAAALGAEVMAEAVAQQKDRRLLARLLEVPGPREVPGYRKDKMGLMAELAKPSADEHFAEAFQEWGLDVDRTPTRTAAARLRSRPGVLTEVIAALDAWASERRRLPQDPPRWQRLADLAAALDNGPGADRRRALRAVLARDRLPLERAVAMLAQLQQPGGLPLPVDSVWGADRRELRQLVQQVDAAAEPVLGLLTLVRALRLAGDDLEAERLLRAAARARPQEVMLRLMLAALLEGQRPPRWQEAVACLEAARALRPELGVSLANALLKSGRTLDGLALYKRLTEEKRDNPWLLFEHANALYFQGRYKEAEKVYRAGLRLKPHDFRALTNLGSVLDLQDRPREGEACHRAAIRLQPHAEVYVNLGAALHAQGRFKEAEAACRAAIRLNPDSPWIHCNLAAALLDQRRYKEAEAACRQALLLKSDVPEAHLGLGNVMHSQRRYKEAEAAFREAIHLRPDHRQAHFNLGLALSEQGRYPEAEAAHRQAIRLKSDYAPAHNSLGNALRAQRRYREAEAAYREAIRLQPDGPRAHTNLGLVLHDQGRFKEAEAAYREAIRLKPDGHQTHLNLGLVLHNQARYKEAEAVQRETIRLWPDDPEAHTRLGNALHAQHRYKEAEAVYRVAIRLQPDHRQARAQLGIVLLRQQRYQEAEAALRVAIRLQPGDAALYSDLGAALHALRRYPEAEAASREAIRLKPDHAAAYTNLGTALGEQGRYQEAEAAFRAAIRLQPNEPQPHCNQGMILRALGRFADALAALRRGHELGSKTPGWPYPSADWVRECERLVVLDRDLPAVLRGEKQPAGAAERLEFADLCQRYQRRHGAATKFYADAFAAEPQLGADLERLHRYNAACSAALAAAGNAVDARDLAVEEWAWFQQQAHDWLRADLKAYTQFVADRNPATQQVIRKRLAHWQRDPDLLAVRDREWLAAMRADERIRWERLWADVAALLRAAGKDG